MEISGQPNRRAAQLSDRPPGTRVRGIPKEGGLTQEPHQSTRRGDGFRRVAATVCLLAPAIGLLWVPWYARTGPEAAGVPFFYWYQFLWVPGTSALMLVAYLLLRARRRGPSG
jgi:hypothetical protein